MTHFRIFFLSFLLLGVLEASAQRRQDIYAHSAKYEYPTDPAVLEKLEKWRDLKFGTFLHWGVYAQAGIPESWPICGEPWPKRDTTMTYEQYKKWYWDLAKEFNPVNFDPEKWAAVSENAGMKYLVFTTKHHDGFSMWDTKQTDYKITNGPFANNPKADLTKHIFEAYRKKGMWIGAYFSKPDWHSQDFWWDRFPTPTRNTNYRTDQYPERWQRFKDFTYNQIGELMNNYGPVDMLWLDGGWVRPGTKEELERDEWGLSRRGRANYPNYSQDVDMPRIAKMAREAQPGIIIADRTIHGQYENFRTPEQSIPTQQIKEPWETNITMTSSWSYRKPSEEKVKPASWVIHVLAEIVAKGGNLLLGFGPTPQGEFPKEVIATLDSVGNWLKPNGEAIYGTRILDHYNDGSTWFTRSKDGKKKYAIACIKEKTPVPATISWKGNVPAKGAKVKLLATGKNVSWKQQGDEVVVTVPAAIAGTLNPALVFAY